MKPIKIEYHFKNKSFSSFISPKYFETDDMKTAIEICENGKSMDSNGMDNHGIESIHAQFEMQ